MQPGIIIIFYLLACLLVGLVGSRRSMGFFAAFFFSLLFSPVVVILVLQLTRTRERSGRDRGRSSSSA